MNDKQREELEKTTAESGALKEKHAAERARAERLQCDLTDATGKCTQYQMQIEVNHYVPHSLVHVIFPNYCKNVFTFEAGDRRILSFTR